MRRSPLSILLVTAAAILCLNACSPKSIKQSCSDQNLPRCEGGQAIQCGYAAGIAGYSTFSRPVSCADGATCTVHQITDMNQQLDQAFCVANPAISCDPSNTALPRCVSDSVVESCPAGLDELVRYNCPDTDGPFPPGCGPGGICTAPSSAPPVDAAPAASAVDAGPAADAGATADAG